MKNFVIFLVFLFSIFHNVHAQPGDPYAVPLDGGASLLAAAGVAYGAKKIYGLRKKKGKKDEDLDI